MQATQRQGFLLSGLVHVIMITLLIRTAIQPRPLTAPVSPAAAPSARPRAVFLPPPAELRKLAPAPRRPAAPLPAPPATEPPVVPTPPPVPPTPRAEARDSISIGPPSDRRLDGPLILRRDQDLSSAPGRAGRPGALATPTPEPPRLGREERPGPGGPGPDPSPTAPEPGRNARTGDDRDLPLGPDGRPRSRPGVQPTDPPPPGGQRSITSSLRRLEERLGERGTLGATGAVGQQMGPLFFDPEGADFTAWTNHFKNEIYRNWIVPQGVLFGALRGHVDFEFTIERDGTLSALRLLKSSGTPALDRSAANALLGARSLPLPSDFRPARVTIQISFFYNESPRS